MAKAKKVSEETQPSEEVKTQKYFIAKKILTEGYFHGNIDGEKIIVSKGEHKTDGMGKKVLQFGSVVEIAKTEVGEDTYDEYRPTGKHYFENLSPLAIHLLTTAGVIKLSEEQETTYKQWLKDVLYAKKVKK